MKILLDTHIWIWQLLGSEELSKKKRTLLESDDNQLFLSSFSVWETYLLIEKKRLPISLEPKRWIQTALVNLAVNEVPFSFAIALESRSILPNHKDPADKFIAATAKVLGICLMTEDKKLKGCREIEVV